jgi:hypothetical protein
LNLTWQLKLRIRFLAIAAVLGLFVGLFVLFPLNEFVFYQEYGSPEHSSGVSFAATQLRAALDSAKPKKTAFYCIAGAILSMAAGAIYASLVERTREIAMLNSALESDLRPLIAKGESATLEFKSSFRWDLKGSRVNRALEGVILKTLAGYMNGNGGTLLIGVGDDGSIVGLENDYRTLKKPDGDGFEQALMTSVATRLGADACHNVRAIFQSIEQKEVCRVITSPAHRPVYVQDGESPGLYVRTGVSTRELNVREALNYVDLRWKR